MMPLSPKLRRGETSCANRMLDKIAERFLMIDILGIMIILHDEDRNPNGQVC